MTTSNPPGKLSWAAISAEEEDSFVPEGLASEHTYAHQAEGVSKLASRLRRMMSAEADPGSRPPGFGFLMDGHGLILPEDSKTIQSRFELPGVGEATRKRNLDENDDDGQNKIRRVSGPTAFPDAKVDPIFSGLGQSSEAVEGEAPSPSPAEKVTKGGIAELMKGRESSSSSGSGGEDSEKCWERRKILRERQVEIGKATQQYEKYRVEVSPSNRRPGVHPVTPDASKRVSKRTFDAEIRIWRKALHEFVEGRQNAAEES